MKRYIVPMIIGVMSIYIMATSIVSVSESEYAVISQFGRPVKVISEAGAAFKLPNPVQTVKRLDKRIQLYSMPSAEYGTLDRRNLLVSTFVIWRIAHPQQFLKSVRQIEIAQQRLDTLTSSEVGAAISSAKLSDIFTLEEKNNQVAVLFDKVTKSASQLAEKELGIEIVAIRPKHLGFPKQNLMAIYKRMESEWEKLAKQYRAEGQEEAAKIRAKTELEIRNLKAQAYRDAQVIRGRSEAEAEKLYAASFNDNSEYYRFTRSLEAYEKILNKNTRLILSADTPIFDTLLQPPGHLNASP